MNEQNLKQIDLIEMGERIRKCRNALGMTREELSCALNVTSKFISDIECGSKGISLKNFVLLVQVLDVSADYLFFGDTEKAGRQLICEMKVYLK